MANSISISEVQPSGLTVGDFKAGTLVRVLASHAKGQVGVVTNFATAKIVVYLEDGGWDNADHPAVPLKPGSNITLTVKDGDPVQKTLNSLAFGS